MLDIFLRYVKNIFKMININNKEKKMNKEVIDKIASSHQELIDILEGNKDVKVIHTQDPASKKQLNYILDLIHSYWFEKAKLEDLGIVNINKLQASKIIEALKQELLKSKLLERIQEILKEGN